MSKLSTITTPTTAVVFAYHTVGVRSLSVLTAMGIRVALVVTHADDPAENQWFDSVAEWADREEIMHITPTDPNVSEVTERISACQPDFIFSFYYRQMLGKEILAIPSKGAYNLHGSLLPHYRGRVPINWAVLHGEFETGVTLHRMILRADAGAWVGQEPVAILPNDTAHHVFQKAVCAGERLLLRVVPSLVDGTVVLTPMDLSQGGYFGRRKPEDGRIDWQKSAWEIHNLIRAVAPPYPGAFFDWGGHRIWILRSHYRQEMTHASHPPLPFLYWQGESCFVDCRDGQRLRVWLGGTGEQPLGKTAFCQLFGQADIPLR